MCESKSVERENQLCVNIMYKTNVICTVFAIAFVSYITYENESLAIPDAYLKNGWIIKFELSY